MTYLTEMAGEICIAICDFLSLSLSLFLSPGWCRGKVPLHRARQRPRLLWGEEVTMQPSADAALFANLNPLSLSVSLFSFPSLAR